MSFFPLQKLKGTQPTRNPAVWVAHLEEEGIDKEGGAESEDPDGNEGVTEELIVHLTRAVKNAQQEEKCCYHCSSPEHFIHKCPLVKASRTATHVNQKEGTALEKEAQIPSSQGSHTECAPEQDTQGMGYYKQTPFLNPNPLHQWYGIKYVLGVRINGESCMALLNNGVQIHTIMPGFVENHSLDVGPLSDLVGR